MEKTAAGEVPLTEQAKAAAGIAWPDQINWCFRQLQDRIARLEGNGAGQAENGNSQPPAQRGSEGPITIPIDPEICISGSHLSVKETLERHFRNLQGRIIRLEAEVRELKRTGGSE